jgi:hypothetical protein
MKKLVMFCCASALIVSLSQPVHAQSTGGSATMPSCSSGDPVVAMNMKTKMYRTEAQLKTKYPNSTPEQMSTMMKAHDAQWMCKSKADAMGGKMMSGSMMTKPAPQST